MIRSCLAAAIVLIAGLTTRTEASGAAVRNSAAASRAPREGMVLVPAGSYRPLYGVRTDPPTSVHSFLLDRDPVRRADYLAFVRVHPQWRRSVVGPRFADRAGYLADWRGDLDPGDEADLRRPVTGVSWHAAKAYCAAQGKRLPTAAEWEYAAAASATARDGGQDPRFTQELLAIYSNRSRPLPPVESAATNVYGVRGLHDLAWEWVEDFQAGAGPHRDHGAHPGAQHLFCASAAIGAADATNYAAFLRHAVRAGATSRTTLETLGFRCAA